MLDALRSGKVAALILDANFVQYTDGHDVRLARAAVATLDATLFCLALASVHSKALPALYTVVAPPLHHTPLPRPHTRTTCPASSVLLRLSGSPSC